MRVKPKQKIQALKISSRSAEVSNLTGSLVTFKIFFEADPMELIDSKVNFCEFKVYEKQKNLSSKVRVKALSSVAALHGATARKSAAKESSEQVIAQGIIDLTKSIPNDRIAAILGGEPARKRKKVTFTDDNDVDALQIINSEVIAPVARDSVDVKSSYRTTFSRMSRDPAAETNNANFHSPAVNAVRGVRTTSDKSKINPKQESLRSALTSKTTTTKRTILEDEELSTIEIDFPIRLRKSQIKEYTVEIIARAPASAGQLGRALQTISTTVDFRRTYENHIIPTVAPSLQFTSVGTQRLMRIKQMDRNGTSVSIFRKNTQSISEQGGRQYKRIANIPLKFGQETQMFDKPGQLGKSIYRVVPYNELSITSGEFSSAVAPGSYATKQRQELDEVTLLAYETGGGVQVSVFNIPNEVVSIRLLRRNVTTHERIFSISDTVQGGPARSFQRLSSELKIFDKPTRVDAVYEYKVALISMYGDEKESLKSCTIHFSGNAQDQEGYAFTTNAPQTTNSSVTFQVDAPTSQASLDLIYNLLGAQGLDAQYADEISRNKQLLSKLTALEMLRFDTITGLNESFGAVETGIFKDDVTSQKSANISPLVPGRRYIYQFRLLIRSPNTIFSDTTISKIDLETGKSFVTNQKKFNSPNVLKKGTLSSNARQVRSITKDGLKFDAAASSNAEMIAGRTALTGQFSIIMPFSDTNLSNVTVETTARGNVVRWNIIEGIQKIDHIVIYAEYNGKLAPLRALHFHGSTKMMYLDDRLKASPDEVKYYVQLVFDDFSQGQRIGPAEELIDAT